MKKLTYGEQLLHPNWQRVRLEKLSDAGFKCEACGDKETTLHVHHKQYFKGRMAWEYSSSELEVLCEPCHEEAHEIDSRLKKLLAALTHKHVEQLTAMLSGFFCGEIDPEDQEKFTAGDTRHSNVGYLAASVYRSNMTEFEFSDLASFLTEQQFMGDLRVALAAANARLEADVDRYLDECERRAASQAAREGDGATNA